MNSIGQCESKAAACQVEARTVAENIDMKINGMKAEITRLENIREGLKQSGLYNLNIRDLQQALSFY